MARQPARLRFRDVRLLVVPAVFLLVAFWLMRREKAQQWIEVGHSSLATIEIETTLYETPESNHVFAHFRITNQTQRPLGVSIRNNGSHWQTMYPYQWLIGPVIFGSRYSMTTDANDVKWHEQRLMSDYKAGKTTIIPAGKTIDYYRESLQGRRDQIERELAAAIKSYSRDWSPYLILGVRGLTPATDGVRVQSINEPGKEIEFHPPLRWNMMPPHSRVIDGSAP